MESDDLDLASEREEIARQAAIQACSVAMPEGRPGECDFCGEHSQRLVGGACAPCRDRYRLK